MSAIGYACGEAWVSLRRSGRSAAMSVGTIAIAFVTLGGFLLVSTNVQRGLDRWRESAELSVYLRDDLSDEARVALEQYLRTQPAVAAVEYASKADALARFRTDFPELADVTASLRDNPFPAAFDVRLRIGTAGDDEAEELARSVTGQPGVADVRYDRRWLARLLALVAIAQAAGLMVAGVLMLGAAFTVAAVVRLSLHARRDEIDIMQLVGAPFSFIRGPFVAEGLMLGGAGAGCALVLLWASYVLAAGWLGADLAGVFATGGMRFLGVRDVLLLSASGLGVGAAAGAVASRAVR